MSIENVRRSIERPPLLLGRGFLIEPLVFNGSIGGALGEGAKRHPLLARAEMERLRVILNQHTGSNEQLLEHLSLFGAPAGGRAWKIVYSRNQFRIQAEALDEPWLYKTDRLLIKIPEETREAPSPAIKK